MMKSRRLEEKLAVTGRDLITLKRQRHALSKKHFVYHFNTMESSSK